MKILLTSFLLIFLFSCTNNEVQQNPNDFVSISPNKLELSNYSGELIYFQITNNSSNTIFLNPDISLFTKYNDKEYVVQRKNEFFIKPSISFSFSKSSKGSDFSNSLGIIIENKEENLIYNENEFRIKPNSSAQVSLSIINKDLYFQIKNEKIPITNQNIYGYLNFYIDNERIKTIEIQIKN